MITNESMKLLYSAIVEYDKLAGRDYLLACNTNKRSPIEYLIIRVNKHNFWHLLGCKIVKTDKSNNSISIDLYNECLSKHDISEYLDYTHTSQELKVKHTIFLNIFNFITNAKAVRICKTDNSPEYYQFKIAVGHYNGIIGYDYENKSFSILFPKTTQSKSVDTFNSDNTAKRILYILSKNINESSFDKIEFSPAEYILKKIITELPDIYQSHVKQMFENTDAS